MTNPQDQLNKVCVNREQGLCQQRTRSVSTENKVCVKREQRLVSFKGVVCIMATRNLVHGTLFRFIEAALVCRVVDNGGDVLVIGIPNVVAVGYAEPVCIEFELGEP